MCRSRSRRTTASGSSSSNPPDSIKKRMESAACPQTHTPSYRPDCRRSTASGIEVTMSAEARPTSCISSRAFGGTNTKTCEEAVTVILHGCASWEEVPVAVGNSTPHSDLKQCGVEAFAADSPRIFRKTRRRETMWPSPFAIFIREISSAHDERLCPSCGPCVRNWFDSPCRASRVVHRDRGATRNGDDDPSKTG